MEKKKREKKTWLLAVATALPCPFTHTHAHTHNRQKAETHKWQFLVFPYFSPFFFCFSTIQAAQEVVKRKVKKKKKTKTRNALKVNKNNNKKKEKKKKPEIIWYLKKRTATKIQNSLVFTVRVKRGGKKELQMFHLLFYIQTVQHEQLISRAITKSTA